MGGKKKGSISEEDVSLLLQRYSATTILALLQEVSQFAAVKIDWKALVKRTSTGITSAREYQMLWRHLAYRDTLFEKLEDVAEPLDDDSDLEFEVEAVPAVSGIALSEAAACVKVLFSSGSQRESCPTSRSTVEAPLTINIPNEQTSRVPPDKQQPSRCIPGVNVIVPVSVQKQPGSSADPDENESPGFALPAKKKRKQWTKEEETELIAAVQKCGEGNWANILKGDFKHDRTASQLSQRWALIRKRQANSKPGSSNKSSKSTRSEERLAAQKAISLAIDMPMTRNLSAIFSGATQSSTPASSSTISAPLSEAQPNSAPHALNQSQQASDLPTSQKRAPNPSNKPRTAPKKPAAHVMPSACPNSSIQAAAFAAGGRIAAPSTAASLLKAAQSKSAVHIIRPVGGALPKSPGTGSKSLPATNTLAPVQTLGGQVCHIQSVVMPLSSNSSMPLLRFGSQQARGGTGRPASFSATSCALASNQATQSETKSGAHVCTTSQENAGAKSGIIISAIDVDELLTKEGGGGSDEMELDGAVGQDHPTGLQILEVRANHNHVVDAAVSSQASVDENLLKSGLNESQNRDSKAELADIGAAEGQAMVIDAGGTPIPAEKGLGMSSESQGVDTASDLKQNAAEKQLDCMDVSASESKESNNILVDRHSDSDYFASGSKSPHDGEAGVD